MVQNLKFAFAFIFAITISIAAYGQPLRPPELPTPDSGTATESIQPGGAEPGYLGLLADDRQENSAGARVKDIMPDSPAAQAGLKTDDLLTSANGRPIHSMDDMIAVLQPLPAGAKVTFEIQRQGQPQTVSVTLGQRPPPDQRKFQQFGRLPDAPPDDSAVGSSSIGQSSQMPQRNFGPQPGTTSAPPPLLGVRTNNVTEQDRARLGLSSTAGAHVIARTRGSAAEKANIPLDAVIVGVNGDAVNSSTDLSALLARVGAGRSVELTYIYNGKTVRTSATLGAMPAGSPMPQGNAWPPSGATPAPPLPGDIAREQNPGSPTGSPTPPQQPTYRVSQPTDAQRIEMLERRVHELEQRIKELEDRSARGT